MDSRTRHLQRRLLRRDARCILTGNNMEQKAPQEETKSESYFHLENKLAHSATVPAAEPPKRSVVPRSALQFPMLKVPPPGALSGTPSPQAQQWGVVISVVITVSYTHLRAHETDSYLVCRLLLEKKKK